MSADLTLFSLPNTTEWRERWAAFQYSHSFERVETGGVDDFDSDALLRDLGDVPQEWVGEVSWLGADTPEDIERYVPGPVGRIRDIVGDGRVLTRGVAKEITVAMNLPNRSIYGRTQLEWVSDPEHLELIRDANRRGYRGYGRLVAPHLVSHKGPGIASGRRISRWTLANVGAFVVTESL